MHEANNEHLRFPIGKFRKPEEITPSLIGEWSNSIQNLPGKLQSAISGLSEFDLKKTYKPGGWTVQQIIHHLADSHLNAFIRFKLTLTEDNPIIKPYIQDKWAELPDSIQAPVDWSMSILNGIHQKWSLLLKNMQVKNFSRTYFHPEQGRPVTLNEALAMYVWHGNHHLAHIKIALSSDNPQTS